MAARLREMYKNEVAPQLMKASLKVAVEHPEVKILNCSLNEPSKHIRTYYARMYEAKFIGPSEGGSKPRAVYITKEQFTEIFGEEF